eukprot:scaffold287_cov173-Amphora_coffeaeformis.AAC.17
MLTTTAMLLSLFSLLLVHLWPAVSIEILENSKLVETSSPILLIDLSSWTADEHDNEHRHAVVEQVKHACQEIGFFAIKNHGIDDSVIQHTWETSKDFFDLPLDTKLQSAFSYQTSYPYGYEQSETLEKGKALDGQQKGTPTSQPDLKETFSIGPNNPLSGMPPRRFPANNDKFRQALESYYSAMERLAATLLEIFTHALDLPSSFFQDKFDRHMCALRLLNYPETTTNTGQIRAGAHSDYGALTILKGGGPGLQVLKQDEWTDVPYLEDAYVINLGDLMQRWTNGKWVSTLHRVVVFGSSNNNRRQSMAFFVNMNADALIEPVPSCISAENPRRYEPITAGQHLMAKHLASVGASDGTGHGDEL